MPVWQSVVLGQRHPDWDDVSVCVCVYGLKVCQCHFGQAYYIYTFVLSFVGGILFLRSFSQRTAQRVTRRGRFPATPLPAASPTGER